MNFFDTESNIRSFIRQFEDQGLPKTQWTHEAHLIVAIWYTWNYELREALIRVRKGIRTYNEAVGTANTDTSGYHETLTRFWLEVASRFIRSQGSSTLSETCRSFVQSKQAVRDFPLQFYSRELLFSRKARHEWVAPDLRAL